MDSTSFTTDNERLNLQIAQQFNKMAPPTRGEVREFHALALSDAVPISRENQKKFFDDLPFGATAVASGKNVTNARFIVKAKIVSDITDEPLAPEGNPHAKLDDPCTIEGTDAASVQQAMALIVHYTTFLSSKDFSMSDDDLTIRKNDKIRVSLTISEEGTLDIQRGEITAIVSRAKEALRTPSDCSNLSDLFK